MFMFFAYMQRKGKIMNENNEEKRDFSLRIEAEAKDGSGTISYQFDSISENDLEALNDFILFVLKVK